MVGILILSSCDVKQPVMETTNSTPVETTNNETQISTSNDIPQDNTSENEQNNSSETDSLPDYNDDTDWEGEVF